MYSIHEMYIVGHHYSAIRIIERQIKQLWSAEANYKKNRLEIVRLLRKITKIVNN